MSVYSSRRLVAVAIVCLLSISPIFVSSMKTGAQTQTNSLGIVIPLYMSPGSNWTSVIQAKQSYSNVPFIAVINPSSGPGSAKDSTFATGIEQLQAAGIIALGYVDTAYAGDNISSVENRVNEYNSWYHVNGIFFDEMQNTLASESYYSTLNTHVHALGMNVTMGNPGAVVPPSEAGVLNILNIYENGGLPTLPSLSYGVSPTSDFSLMAYDISNLNETFLQSATGYVGYVYLTNLDLPNPYGVLPSYFTSEVAALSALDASYPSASPSPTTPTTTTSSTTTTTTTSISKMATITVRSVSGGSSFSGMYTTIQSGGRIVDSGFTPLSYTGTIGTKYTITIDNYAKYVFTNWNGGSTDPSQTFSLASNVFLTAYYSTTSTLLVNSVNFLGNPISGYYTQLYDSSQNSLNSGFTPASYTLTNGQMYQIQAANYGPCTFSHWSDGSIANPTSISIASPTTLTAVYSGSSCGPTTSTITVSTVNSHGSPISGYYIELWQNGLQINHCFSSCSLTVNDGQTYQIYASSYGTETFNHWKNDGSTGAETVSVPNSGTAIELTAVYSP
jgi:Spherulation-specific family 4